MEKFTIREISSDTDTWGDPPRVKIDYKVLLDGPGGPIPQEIILTQMEKSQPPEVGKEINGTVDWDFFKGPKFQRDSSDYGGAGGGGQGGFSGGGGGGGGGGAGKSEEFWSARARAIQNQHSQEMALMLVQATGCWQGLDLDTATPEVIGATFKTLEKLAKGFDTITNRAAAWPDDPGAPTATPGSGNGSAQAPAQAPQQAPQDPAPQAPQPEAAPAGAQDDDDIPF